MNPMATAVFTYRIPSELKDRLRAEAARRGCSMSRLVERYINDGLKKQATDNERLAAFADAARTINGNA